MDGILPSAIAPSSRPSRYQLLSVAISSLIGHLGKNCLGAITFLGEFLYISRGTIAPYGRSDLVFFHRLILLFLLAAKIGNAANRRVDLSVKFTFRDPFLMGVAPYRSLG